MSIEYSKALKALFQSSNLKKTYLMVILLIISSGLSNLNPLFKNSFISIIFWLASISATILLSGYYIEIFHREINNILVTLPEFKEQYKKYFINGFKYALVNISLGLIFLIIALITFFIIFVALKDYIGTSAKITSIIILILSELFFYNLISQVVTARLGSNYKLSEAFQFNKALEILFGNFISYLKTFGVVTLITVGVLIVFMVIAIIVTPFVSVLYEAVLTGFNPDAVINYKSSQYNGFNTFIFSILFSPLAAYIQIVATDLYAQTYRNAVGLNVQSTINEHVSG